MKKIIKAIQVLFILVLLNSCMSPTIEKSPTKKNEEVIPEKSSSKNNSKIELKFSCGEKGLSKYIDDGWVIVEEYSEEKICTWKSFPASKDCDMEKDKGCKITEPDKIGEEKTYILEKK